MDFTKTYDPIIDEQPSSEHRQLMPRTEAFLHEVLRVSSVTPITTKKATRDVRLGKYFLPKGTNILVNIYGINRDESEFPEPIKFKPERFYQDGKFSPSVKVVPFSWGKRDCIGRSLALIQFFIFVTSIVQKFKVACPLNEPQPKDIGRNGVHRQFRYPEPFSTMFLARAV